MKCGVVIRLSGGLGLLRPEAPAKDNVAPVRSYSNVLLPSYASGEAGRLSIGRGRFDSCRGRLDGCRAYLTAGLLDHSECRESSR